MLDMSSDLSWTDIEGLVKDVQKGTKQKIGRKSS